MSNWKIYGKDIGSFDGRKFHYDIEDNNHIEIYPISIDRRPFVIEIYL